jgi:hypothetical protein
MTQRPTDEEAAWLVAWLRDRSRERETLSLPGGEVCGELRTAPFLLARVADLLDLSPIATKLVVPGAPGHGRTGTHCEGEIMKTSDPVSANGG